MTANNFSPAWKIIAYSAAFFGGTLLFQGGPDAHALRSINQAWNLGHIIFFAALAVIFRHHGKKHLPRKFVPLAVVLLFLTLAMGSITEIIQGYCQRTPDILDIWRDCLGTLTALAFLPPTDNFLNPRSQRLFRLLVIVLTIVTLVPLGKALVDETVARHQFPLLADFENPLETGRWERGRINHQLARHGKASLQVLLTTEQYSGDSLLYFPPDWSLFSFLHFSIHNGSRQPLTLVCRIHDRRHSESGNAYSDRFNRRIICQPGWNDFTIPLREVEDAPTGRKMDMAAIVNLCIFSVQLPRAVTIHLDYFYLEK